MRAGVGQGAFDLTGSANCNTQVGRWALLKSVLQVHVDAQVFHSVIKFFTAKLTRAC